MAKLLEAPDLSGDFFEPNDHNDDDNRDDDVNSSLSLSVICLSFLKGFHCTRFPVLFRAQKVTYN